MQCQRCSFENMPGQDRCFKCGSILEDPANTVTEIYPPRMPGWKRPIRTLHRITRLNRFTPVDSIRAKTRSWFRPGSSELLLGLVLSLVPGLAHLLQGKFKKVAPFLPVWIAVLAGAVYLYGTEVGMLLFGFSIAIHAWIMISHSLIDALRSIGERIVATVLILLALALIYRTVPRILIPGFTGRHTPIAAPAHNIEAGDYFLARRIADPNELARGSMLLARFARLTVDRSVGINRGQLPSVGQLVGFPGETVVIGRDLFVVNGKPLDPNEFPVPRWLNGRVASVTIPEGSYFLSSAYSLSRQIPLREELIAAMLIIEEKDIEARAFMIWLPISRRGFLKDFD